MAPLPGGHQFSDRGRRPRACRAAPGQGSSCTLAVRKGGSFEHDAACRSGDIPGALTVQGTGLKPPGFYSRDCGEIQVQMERPGDSNTPNRSICQNNRFQIHAPFDPPLHRVARIDRSHLVKHFGCRASSLFQFLVCDEAIRQHEVCVTGLDRDVAKLYVGKNPARTYANSAGDRAPAAASARSRRTRVSSARSRPAIGISAGDVREASSRAATPSLRRSGFACARFASTMIVRSSSGTARCAP